MYMAWTFCFPYFTAERGGTEEWKGPAGRRVCDRSRWCQRRYKMHICSLSAVESQQKMLFLKIFKMFRSIFNLCLLSCRKYSCNRLPETERHPHGLQGLHHCQQGILQKPEAWVKVFWPISFIYSSKLSPRWCRQMLMVSLLEEMWLYFLSRHATTRRWTSLIGKWLMYMVSV